MSDTAFNAKQVQCGGCGAPLVFKTGSGRVLVCTYCGFAVARTDRGFETLGQQADLVETGAKLALGATGKMAGVPFTLVGRVQYAWTQGVWDEWYASFDDGRWGWVAEAQGHYYVSFKASDRPIPPLSSLAPGRSLVLKGLGRFVVTEVRQAHYKAARGELPEVFPTGGELLTFVDLEGDKQAFATVDFSDATPLLFLGKEVPFAALGIGTEHLPPPSLEKIKGQKITCPKCNGPIELQVPDQALRVTCSHCAALLDASQGSLKFLAQMSLRKLDLPLGSRGTFNGVEYLVIGWMQRACTVEGDDYYWEEFLLYDEATASYRFLLRSDGHWSFVEPISAGSVEEGPAGASYGGAYFKLFSRVTARVTNVLGEFYWAVAKGEKVDAADYIRPPLGLSREANDEEVVWSKSTYLEPEEVAAAFKKPALPDGRTGPGTIQPNPWSAQASAAWAFGGICALVVVALFIFFEVRGPGRTLFDQNLTGGEVAPAMGAAAAEGAGASETFFSPPFQIPDDHRNVEIEFSTEANQTWAAINGALINEATLEVTEFDLEGSYYSGSDSDGSWSEDNRRSSTFISGDDLPAGKYTLRVEQQWEKGRARPPMHLRLVSGVPRLWQPFVAILFLLGLPLLFQMFAAGFEAKRWEQSTTSWGGSEDD